MSSGAKILFLFDVDGTLTECGQKIEPKTVEFLRQLHTRADVAIISGSDLDKLIAQFGKDIFGFEYIFTENGCVAYKGHTMIGKESIIDFLGEEKLMILINYLMDYMSKLWLPFKRGTFIDVRTSLINVSPVGRSCTLKERLAFNAYDETHNVRKSFVKNVQEHFADWGLQFSIGGHVGFDIFPIGCDKSYCLKFLNSYDTVHFFGDKTLPGENDFEICKDVRTVGHSVKGPKDTMQQVEEILTNTFLNGGSSLG